MRGNSAVVLLCSNDLRRWRQAHIFEPPVKVSSTAEGSRPDTSPRPTTRSTYSARSSGLEKAACPRASSMYWTRNGLDWSSHHVLRLGDTYPYTWRVRFHQGKFYSSISYMREGGPLDRLRAAVIEAFHALLPGLKMDLVQIALVNIGGEKNIQRLRLAHKGRAVGSKVDKPALVEFEGGLEYRFLVVAQKIQVLDGAFVGRDRRPDVVGVFTTIG